jgi:hypothetical protein
MLRPVDSDYLEQLGLEYEVTSEHGMVCVVVKGWELPAGYQPDHTDLLVRLPPQFPDAPPDMFWVDPPVRYASTGAAPRAADSLEEYIGRSWQRFSRHLAPGMWQPGRDSLQSYLALIRQDLIANAPATA